MGSELLCKRGCYGSTELAIVVPTRCWRELFANFFCTGNDILEILPDPGLRFALNASPFGRRRASLRPASGSLIHQEVGPNEKIKRGQIKLTESIMHRSWQTGGGTTQP